MHSFEWEGLAYNEALYGRGEKSETTVTFLHNGDFSGNVKVSLPERVSAYEYHDYAPGNERIETIHLPFAAMKALVLEYFRRKMISALEDAEGEELEQLVFDEVVEDANRDSECKCSACIIPSTKRHHPNSTKLLAS